MEAVHARATLERAAATKTSHGRAVAATWQQRERHGMPQERHGGDSGMAAAAACQRHGNTTGATTLLAAGSARQQLAIADTGRCGVWRSAAGARARVVCCMLQARMRAMPGPTGPRPPPASACAEGSKSPAPSPPSPRRRRAAAHGASRRLAAPLLPSSIDRLQLAAYGPPIVGRRHMDFPVWIVVRLILNCVLLRAVQY